MTRSLPLVLALIFARGPSPAADMNAIAQSYVKLVLELGEHDADYVDAYYGPPEWREQARAAHRPLPEIQAASRTLQTELAAIAVPQDPLVVLRQQFLQKQLAALIARVDMLAGKKLSFDDETRALYDATAPVHGEDHFKS